MQKADVKNTDKSESDQKINITNSKNNLYSLYLKALSNTIKNLIKIQLIPKEKNLRDKINVYFSQMTSTIKLLAAEIEGIISQYESILKNIEQKIRILYSDIFHLQIKNTFLENNIDILTKKEKEYKMIKEKTGIIVENGIIIYNGRKDNEIFILRKENSTLKNERYNKEKEKYENKILILNQKIDKLNKGKSYSSININTNDNIENNLRLNFTINNSTNIITKNKTLTNRINNSPNNDNYQISYTKRNLSNKRKYDSVLFSNNKNHEKHLLNTEKNYKKLSNCQSTGNIYKNNRMINKITKITKIESNFDKDLYLNNLNNISHTNGKNLLCLTLKNSNQNSGINISTFQKIIDNKKENQSKITNKNCFSNKNCVNNNNKNEIKAIYKKKSNNKINNNSKNKSKRQIKKELTSTRQLSKNNSVAINNYNKINNYIFKQNNREKNITNFIKSPRNIVENNKRKRNLFSHLVENENIGNNQINLTSIKTKKPFNINIKSGKKNMFNSPKI